MRSRWNGFRSPLATGIQDFLAYERAIGQKFQSEEDALRLFDAFLVQQRVQSIEEITAEVVDAFLISRPRPRPRSYNHLVSVIRRLFGWLMRHSYSGSFPFQLQPRRESSQRIPYLFTAEIARKLLVCAGNLEDQPLAPLRGPIYRTIFALLYGLGLRIGEVSRLCIKDVDLERSLLVIRQTKFAKSRLAPYGPRMGELLEEYLRVRAMKHGLPLDESPVFTFGGGRSVHPATIRLTFRFLITQLGLQVPQGVSTPRVHDLRHSFAVSTLLRWYRAGIDPGTRLLHLATFLGHVDPNSTAVYLTITPDLLQEANQRFEQFAASTLQEKCRL